MSEVWQDTSDESDYEISPAKWGMLCEGSDEEGPKGEPEDTATIGAAQDEPVGGDERDEAVDRDEEPVQEKPPQVVEGEEEVPEDHPSTVATEGEHEVWYSDVYLPLWPQFRCFIFCWNCFAG